MKKEWVRFATGVRGGGFGQVVAGLGGCDRMALGFVLQLLIVGWKGGPPRRQGRQGWWVRFAVGAMDGAPWCARAHPREMRSVNWDIRGHLGHGGEGT